MSTGDSRPEDVSVYNKYSGEWFVFIVLLLVGCWWCPSCLYGTWIIWGRFMCIEEYKDATTTTHFVCRRVDEKIEGAGLSHSTPRSPHMYVVFLLFGASTLFPRPHCNHSILLVTGDVNTGGYGCPSGNLDRCLNLCAHNPSLPQNDVSTQTAYVVQPKLFNDCVVTCRTFCSW